MATREGRNAAALSPTAGRRRVKRADLIVAEIKRLIANGVLRVGARLPPEQEMITEFGAARGTIREAMKSLEVQGLVRIVPGPGGGARVIAVSEAITFDLLDNYIRQQHPTVEDIREALATVAPGLSGAEPAEVPGSRFPLRARSNWQSEVPRTRAAVARNPLLHFFTRYLVGLLAEIDTEAASTRPFGLVDRPDHSVPSAMLPSAEVLRRGSAANGMSRMEPRPSRAGSRA